MIVPMKKYSFLVYHQEYDMFLEGLKERGVLHVKEREGATAEDEALSDNLQLLTRYNNAINALTKLDVEADASASVEGGFEALEAYEANRQALDKANVDLQHVEKELQYYEPWGEFSQEKIDNLKASGWELNFFSCASRDWNSTWEEKYNTFEVSHVGSTIYFVTITPEGTALDLDADPVKLPSSSFEVLAKEKQETIDSIETLNQQQEELAKTKLSALEKGKAIAEEGVDLNNVVLNTHKAAEDKLMILEGFVPEENEEEINQFLSDKGVYFESSKPTLSESAPILLKNNKFNRLFEQIGELYSMPQYAEMDLTPYFAPFYWLFFGFCLGDAGYGLLLMLGGFIGRTKVKESLKGSLTLVGLLGISTILFGLIGGTFFGMNLYEMKFSIWGDIADQYGTPEKPFNINDHLFNLALVLGAIQILFGMVIKVINETKMYGLKYAYGSLGWLILIGGGAAVYGISTIEGISPMLVKVLTWTVVAIGGAGAFLFNNPERNIAVNFGAGLWDAYNMATGLMGDLLSYIRLFALGISSAILGYVFNSLAMEMSGDVPVLKIIIMVIILLIGHGINIFMSSLGSFVHPMRLTFVEFYKNSGFQGGGKKYSPFKNKQ